MLDALLGQALILTWL